MKGANKPLDKERAAWESILLAKQLYKLFYIAKNSYF